ncbi:MAG: 30S ribosome-binding factor RbfA [Candidatus Doudnabacteria bacterium]|nr:30S ribosome-binding factor RbfA [Candidatus Doudnabacteria bacterium]
MTLRTEKVSSLIHKKVAELLLGLELPAMVTVGRVETSGDLRHAKVFITILPSDEALEKKVLDVLSAEIYDLQGSLNRELAMKIIPRLSFEIDYSPSYAAGISKLLKDVKD